MEKIGKIEKAEKIEKIEIIEKAEKLLLLFGKPLQETRKTL